MVHNPKVRVTAPAPANTSKRGGGRARGGPAGKVKKKHGASDGAEPDSSNPPLCGKNLRWTAVALARKLCAERERSSTELCDEVAADAAAEARALHPGRDVSGVERNTRRRVYDAMKVMSALGVVVRVEGSGTASNATSGSGGGNSRDTRRLRWVSPRRAGIGAGRVNGNGGDGVDTMETAHPDLEPLQAKASELRTRISQKRAQARQLGEYLAAFEDESATSTAAPSQAPGPRVEVPFLVVAGVPLSALPSPAENDTTQLCVDYGYTPPKTYNEMDILRLLHAQRTAPKSKKRPRSNTTRPPPAPVQPAVSVSAPAAAPAPAPVSVQAAAPSGARVLAIAQAMTQQQVRPGPVVAPGAAAAAAPAAGAVPGVPGRGGVRTPLPEERIVIGTPVKKLRTSCFDNGFSPRFSSSPATPAALMCTFPSRARASLLTSSGKSDIDNMRLTPLGDLGCLEDADFGST